MLFHINQPFARRGSIFSRSASSAIIAGAIPPCSRVQRAPGASLLFSMQPTRALPIKPKKRHTRIPHQISCYVIVGYGSGLTICLRQSSFSQQFNETKTRQCGIGSRLDYHRTTGGNSRADLMHNQIEWMIKSADCHCRANRLSARHHCYQ